MLPVGDVVPENVLELVETAVAELLRQARERRGVDPGRFGNFGDRADRGLAGRIDDARERLAGASAELERDPLRVDVGDEAAQLLERSGRGRLSGHLTNHPMPPC